MATMLMTSVIPCDAPEAAASIRFVCVFSTFKVTFPMVTGTSVSGIRILAIMMAPGAAITDAVIRYFAGIPIAT